MRCDERHNIELLEKFVMDTIDYYFLNDRPGQRMKVDGVKKLIASRFEFYQNSIEREIQSLATRTNEK